MNVEQIQMELMNRVRVVWVGAHIPIWLSDFVSLDIKIGIININFHVQLFLLIFINF